MTHKLVIVEIYEHGTRLLLMIYIVYGAKKESYLLGTVNSRELCICLMNTYL